MKRGTLTGMPSQNGHADACGLVTCCQLGCVGMYLLLRAFVHGLGICCEQFWMLSLMKQHKSGSVMLRNWGLVPCRELLQVLLKTPVCLVMLRWAVGMCSVQTFLGWARNGVVCAGLGMTPQLWTTFKACSSPRWTAQIVATTNASLTPSCTSLFHCQAQTQNCVG